MLKVGLTGGIGAGKSAVGTRLAQLGAVVVDADLLAREVVAPGTEGLSEIVVTFGETVLTSDGSLDRSAVAARVFSDVAARCRLEEIIHPRVRHATTQRFAEASPDAIVVNDVPLLVEAGLAATFDLVIVVEAPERVRIDRLAHGRGMAARQAAERIAAQTSEEQRQAAADAMVDNSGDLEELQAQVDALWADRLVPYERNLRARRAVRRPERLEIVEHDPSWAAAYERIAARLLRAVGDAAIRVDHIGSTSVPGLAARDVIDIQMSVTDVEVADRIAGALAAAGFPRLPGVWSDTPKPYAPDPALWRKRLHGGADPGRILQLHLRAVGSAGWRYALLFRDWLRESPAARDEYARHKRQLARAASSTTEYAAAKGPWFDEVAPRAEEWARGVGWNR